jgi:hypothetical protein
MGGMIRQSTNQDRGACASRLDQADQPDLNRQHGKDKRQDPDESHTPTAEPLIRRTCSLTARRAVATIKCKRPEDHQQDEQRGIDGARDEDDTLLDTPRGLQPDGFSVLRGQ